MSRLQHSRQGSTQQMQRSRRGAVVTVYEAETGKRLDVELSDREDGTDALRRRLYRCNSRALEKCLRNWRK